MKFVRFQSSGKVYYGALEGNNIEVFSDAPWSNGKKTNTILPVNECKIIAPCTPNKILCTAINFPGSTGMSSDHKEPLVFIKSSNTVIGNGEYIVSPFNKLKAWGEPELAIVISKRLKNANIDDVEKSIFGYTIANDVTVENISGWDHHLARSKSIDTFCVLGPHIDTEFKPANQKITGFHNDSILREGYLSDRISKEPELLCKLSKWITIEPGDVVITGSPTRVREREYFQDGDTFECKIDGLGSIKNNFQFKNYND